MNTEQNKKYSKLVDAQPNRCFENAIRLSINFGLKYCEGYAIPLTVNIPIEHAWNLDSNGDIIDSTWIDAEDVTMYFSTEEFLQDQVAEYVSKHSHFRVPMYYFFSKSMDRHMETFKLAIERAREIT